MATSMQQQTAGEAIAEINTPEHIGRMLIARALQGAAKQQQAGKSGPYETTMQVMVSLDDDKDLAARNVEGGCFCIHVHGGWVCFCPEL
ncbi:hypothetical protein RKE29_26740 [Streptomyces sp. B1866]|uniref:hypothetical protein n=1 Tax=Streptomyces sp. B1866 TaxID=3075431 RepID=UPI00288D444E|nr:hypothetical protein [Streptomyces sp. B1866]MDT3400174.1 hypothetical protein [Streptomyces sp. B1866]